MLCLTNVGQVHTRQIICYSCVLLVANICFPGACENEIISTRFEVNAWMDAQLRRPK